VSHIDPDSTGLNPAWRGALAHVVWGESWDEGAPASVIYKARQDVKDFTKVIESLAPGLGSYFNEVHILHAWASGASIDFDFHLVGILIRRRPEKYLLWVSLF
jgi:hypothetical protein